ncbi:alpha/beta fold hydrolase [Phytomonospora endophytica]|uniref:Pimeloyl-ACP methyl ester carboxylesterase n=1 Tax=Phytomonospora endophytica TaxID=714109 RepID=A0A841FJU3_9ACTN|nr:alpha/beta hydrolase [Phytomonospora endophytica]MBB6033417.1 pimeloyl-ACP methyl ester carboxylesterase [Phytomonospora endophytica]GIG70812.1 hydrolase [Phytomonospora endophytica]
MNTATLTVDGRTIAYTDFGGTGRPVLALHGHLGEAATWTPLATALAGEWRVIAPDQRGHGDSDRAATYTSAEYAADAVALLDHLGLDAVPVIGHSGGALTAVYLSALHPARVTAIIAGEIPAVLDKPGSLDFVLGLPYTGESREALTAALGPLATFVGDRLRELPDGTARLPFHPQDTVASERAGHGEHWDAWTTGTCPALVIRGAHGGIVTEDMAADMAARRPGTRIAVLDADHFLLEKDPSGFAAAVRDFLR